MNKRAWECLYRGTDFVVSCVSVILGLIRDGGNKDSEIQASLCYIEGFRLA